jgi:hypothetical protein
MQMKYILPTNLTSIHYRSETINRPFFFSQNTRQGHNLTQELRMRRIDMRQRLNMTFWDDQKMYICLRIYVTERKDILILVNFGTRQLPGDNFTENTISRHNAFLLKTAKNYLDRLSFS